MNATKKWYQSTTIWGIVTGALGFLLYSIGVKDQPIPANADFEQLKVYAEAIKNANGNLTVIIGQILEAVGVVTAIIGRIKAEAIITA
jgi:hypothetical protein